jgi:prepilin-type N-terminal cleavage/methylation domain-containing protein
MPHRSLIPYPISLIPYPSSPRHGEGGFSLLELLLAIAIIAIILTVALLSWLGYQRSQALDVATRDLQNLLREAQGNAIGRVNDASWGVRIWNSVPGGLVASCGNISPPAGCSGSGSQCAELFFSTAAPPVYTQANVTRRVTVPKGADYSLPGEGNCKDIIFEERTGNRISGSLVWVSYQGDSNLRVASHVGSGGTGCNLGLSPDAWKCETIDGPQLNHTLGGDASLSPDPSGNPWISYYDRDTFNDTGALKVATYTGSGTETSCGGNPNWKCTIVDHPPGNDVAVDSDMAFDFSGKAWVSYPDTTAKALKVANYVGQGGTGCSGGSPAWNCTTVDKDPAGLNLVGDDPTIAFDFSGRAWVAYSDVKNHALKVAIYTGSGTETSCAGGDPNWNCMTVDDPLGKVVGDDPAIAFSPSGNAWVSYHDDTSGAQALKVAIYVGSGGTGCDGGSSEWRCMFVDKAASGSLGMDSSIAFDRSGTAWISYRDGENQSLKVAKYVGSGGTGCAPGSSLEWSCETVDKPGNNVGIDTSINFDISGKPWVSYHDNTATSLKVAWYTGSGTEASCGPPGGPWNPNWRCEVVDNPASTSGSEGGAVPNPFESVVLYLTSQPSRTRVVKIGIQGAVTVQ